MKHELLPSIFQFIMFFFSIHLPVTAANDSIYPGNSLSANQTLVSKNGRFELGYFTPGNSQDYYIGIWYKFTSNNETIILVANREKPVTNITASQLELTQNGNLLLLTLPKNPVWASNSISNKSKIAATLLDTGNFVVRAENSDTLIWQSFENPTDTWLPGGWIEEHQTLTSWKNPTNPSPGLFSLSVGPNGQPQEFLQWNNSVAYWVSGEWKGRYFALIPEMALQNVFLFNCTFVNYKRRITYTVNNSSMITRLVLDATGQLRRYSWISGAWVQHWIRPQTICNVYSLCGVYGLCTPTGEGEVCSCPQGYAPVSQNEWNTNEWSQGCKRITRPNCSNYNGTNHDGFILMPNMGVSYSQTLEIAARSENECELKCLSNCSCTAYVYQNGCRVWMGGVRSLQQLSAGDSSRVDFYLRVSASDLSKSASSPKHSNHTATIVSVMVIAAAFVTSAILGLTWRSRNNTKRKIVIEDGLVRYSYREIVKITKNFSSELGRGSFGAVFKETLQDKKKTAVAVKRLEVYLKQGEKQFRAEISTLGTIQHVNLIRLRGFCCRGSERLLVYDYMPNGSLDTQIFRSRSPAEKVLDWKTRYRIISGMAKGLRYLHENCRECVVHCDVKPENVLLDGDMRAKVADFGMAKLMGRDSSRVLTTLRGTVGYLAPEWISGVAITTKVDVYGFGMMVFEIVSGWRNAENPRSEGYFPVAAAKELVSGSVMGLLDERLDGDCGVDEEEVRRTCMVACWCIQDDESDRPTMEEVVRVLEGVSEMNLPPVPRSLHDLTQDPRSLSI